MALGVIAQIAAGTAHGLVQDKGQASKAPKLKKEFGLIDWTRTAQQVCNQVRAMQPWPTAYTFFHQAGHPAVRVIVNRGKVCDDIDFEVPLPPGRLAVSHSNRLIVGTGRGPAEVLELQPAGKRRMPAAEFVRGHPLHEGDRFGPESG
jgi:methionyl-tRNA formyltransferase